MDLKLTLPEVFFFIFTKNHRNGQLFEIEALTTLTLSQKCIFNCHGRHVVQAGHQHIFFIYFFL